MILVSSNPNKIAEFKSFLGDSLIIESGKDIKEVFGSIDDVILYKALEAGDGYIVEDSVLTVNGEEIVDIRWKIDALKDGDKAIWTTSLGYNHDGIIDIFRGIQEGIITKKRGNEGFAFDPYFIPIELVGTDNELTLKELKEDKQNYSARIFALMNLISMNVYSYHEISSIKDWTGSYQNE